MASTTENSASTIAYEFIREEILSYRLRPGLRIYERELAERMNLSKTPIRDALIRLEHENLVVVRPRIGYQVMPISVEDSIELYEMRLLLERATVLRVIETADDAALENIAKFRITSEGMSARDWVRHDRAFHSQIAQSCNNNRLKSAAIDAIDHVHRLTYLGIFDGSEPPLAKLAADHCEIIDAILARDKRQAVAHMSKHIETARKRLIGHLETVAIVS
jgi:GntR family transcriptional regulator, rspAB operon transcriptional repressor